MASLPRESEHSLLYAAWALERTQLNLGVKHQGHGVSGGCTETQSGWRASSEPLVSTGETLQADPQQS